MIAVRHLSRRFVVILTVALCAAVVGGIARTAIVPDREQPLLASGEWYCLESSAGDAACRLPPSSGRYTLVIGCLADASGSHQVRIKLTHDADHGGHVPTVEQSARLLQTCPITKPAISRNALASGSAAVCDSEPDASAFRLIESNQEPALKHATATGATRDFFIHVTDGELNDPQQYARITAQCVSKGNRVRVFVDQQLGANGMRDSQVGDLIHLLETDVLPRVEAQFGSLVDVDHDGRFAIVISPWLSRLQGGRVSINGMVRSSDFRRDVASPFGNQCDMLLLNSALPCGAALRDLLSHEVAHAACISQRVRRQPARLGDEQDWVSEGLAHLAEPTTTNSAERIATFLDDPSQHPLVISDYYRAGLWRDPGCRGATVLFSRWCVEKHGHDLCRRLAQSSESGCRSFEQATSARFEDLFRQWSVSLADKCGSQSRTSSEPISNLHATKVRRQQLAVSHTEASLQIRGTAFAVVELPANNSSSAVLRINGDSAAHLQYSIRRNAATKPTVESQGR